MNFYSDVILFQLPRRLSSNVQPIRRYPKTLAATLKKDESVTSTSVVSCFLFGMGNANESFVSNIMMKCFWFVDCC